MEVKQTLTLMDDLTRVQTLCQQATQYVITVNKIHVMTTAGPTEQEIIYR